MTDPLWFLETLEDNETKSDQNDFNINFNTQDNAGPIDWINESKPKEDLSQEVKPKIQNEDEDKIPKVIDLLKDEESLRLALQNSLLESIQNGQTPKIEITVNSKPEVPPSNQIEENTASTSQNENSKIFITLNKRENGKNVGEEKKFVINGQNTEVGETVRNNEQSNVYVILPPEQNSQSSVGSPESDNTNQKYEEVGSTVINLNDLISANGNSIATDGGITANVDLSSIIGSSDGAPKVELLIKIKDDRDKSDQAAKETLNSYTENDITRLKELLKSSATLESLETQLEKKEVRNVPIQVTSSTSTHQRPADPSVDWVDKTTDSFVRRDGAQCTRTVWTSPQGRRVETNCFRDDRSLPRSRKMREDWSPRINSLFNDFDYDIDRIFSYANRFF